MAVASTGIATPIYPHRVVSGGAMNAAQRRIAEYLHETFLLGTPVQINASGFIAACPTISAPTDAATGLIAGFSAEPGNNLNVSGVAQTLTYGSVQNQPNAVLIPVGAPPDDGAIGFNVALDETLFVGTFGNSSDGTLPIVSQAVLGLTYGLTKDAGNGYWYIDQNITIVADGACVQITDFVTFEPISSPFTLNGKLEFKVLHDYCQLSGL